MNKKIINKIPEEAKVIKVTGQGSYKCEHDCSHWHETSGHNQIIAGGMVPVCYERVCSGYYSYDAHWTSSL